MTKRWWAAGPLEYWHVAWIAALMAGLGALAEPFLGYRAVGLLLLCGNLALGSYFTVGPVLLGALLSALAWDFLFIPPRYTFAMAHGEDALMMAAYLASATFAATLSAKVRLKQAQLEAAAGQSQLLLRLSRLLSGSAGEAALVEALSELEKAMGLELTVFKADEEGRLPAWGLGPRQARLNGAEAAAAAWAMKARQNAGWSTPEHADSRSLFLPLEGLERTLGVLAARPGEASQAGGASAEILGAAARLLASCIERGRLEQKSRDAQLLKESERLHQALLNSISHELRTPLAALLGQASALRGEADPQRRQELLDEVMAAGERLNRVIDNLLHMARLNSGVLKLNLDWQDPAEWVRLTLKQYAGPLSGHRVEAVLEEGLQLVKMDYRLMEQALGNLLLNAAAYSPVGGLIQVRASAQGGWLRLAVRDGGPGIPKAELGRVFDKFYRLPGSPAGGTGLGLHIARSLAEAHAGRLEASNHAGGGAEFLLQIPGEPPPPLPAEAA